MFEWNAYKFYAQVWYEYDQSYTYTWRGPNQNDPTILYHDNIISICTHRQDTLKSTKVTEVPKNYVSILLLKKNCCTMLHGSVEPHSWSAHRPVDQLALLWPTRRVRYSSRRSVGVLRSLAPAACSGGSSAMNRNSQVVMVDCNWRA